MFGYSKSVVKVFCLNSTWFYDNFHCDKNELAKPTGLSGERTVDTAYLATAQICSATNLCVLIVAFRRCKLALSIAVHFNFGAVGFRENGHTFDREMLHSFNLQTCCKIIFLWVHYLLLFSLPRSQYKFRLREFCATCAETFAQFAGLQFKALFYTRCVDVCNPPSSEM